MSIDSHEHFGRLSETYGDDYKQIEHKKYPANRYRLDIIKRLLSDISPDQVLDVGCGTGDPLIEIARLGINVQGFDFSEEMVSKARTNLVEAGLNPGMVVRDDMESPAHFAEQSFDCLVALGSVYYARNFEATMTNLTRLLKPEGSFIFSLRNKLFSLFSINTYTVDFFLDELIPMSKLSGQARDELNSIFATRFNQPEVETEVEKRFGNVDTAGVHSIFHNPLTIAEEVLRPLNMECEKIHYYHYHALPPILEHKISAEFRSLSSEMELSDDWRGTFMASGFVVHARRL